MEAQVINLINSKAIDEMTHLLIINFNGVETSTVNTIEKRIHKLPGPSYEICGVGVKICWNEISPGYYWAYSPYSDSVTLAYAKVLVATIDSTVGVTVVKKIDLDMHGRKIVASASTK